MNKKLTITALFIMAFLSNNLYATTSYDVVYCSSCTVSDMKTIASDQLGSLKNKTVFVVNQRNNEIKSFEVKQKGTNYSKTSVTESPVDKHHSMLIGGVIKNIQSIKKSIPVPLKYEQLNPTDNPNFPQSAHAMVSSPNAVFQLTNAISGLFSNKANLKKVADKDKLLFTMAKYATANQILKGHPVFVEFNDGSTVDLVIAEVDMDGISGNSIVRVEKVSNSMKDFNNNRLPDDASDLLGKHIDLGSGSHSLANIAAWKKMLNRLRVVNHVSGNQCSLENTNQVNCAQG